MLYSSTTVQHIGLANTIPGKHRGTKYFVKSIPWINFSGTEKYFEFLHQGSRWTFQATRMNGDTFGWQILPDQMQVNL